MMILFNKYIIIILNYIIYSLQQYDLIWGSVRIVIAFITKATFIFIQNTIKNVKYYYSFR